MSNNNNGNGNHSNLDSETADSIESSDLGEVKIALGRLYREFENFKQSQKTERERDRAELQAWAQTNLIQNQLLSKAMVTIEMLTTELKNQNLSSNEFEKNNEDLRQELTPLLTQLKNMPKSSATLESLEFKGLKSEISQLKSNWNDLLIHTKNLTTVIQELKNSPPPKPITIEKEVYRSEPLSKYGMMGLITTSFALSMFFSINQFIPVKISDDIHNYLQSISQRTGYSNTKLQRIEKHLGTDQKRNK
jgi:chromosome segregation ATPase